MPYRKGQLVPNAHMVRVKRWAIRVQLTFLCTYFNFGFVNFLFALAESFIYRYLITFLASCN